MQGLEYVARCWVGWEISLIHQVLNGYKMFGLFKRTKIAKWEIDLLRNVLANLPTKYSILINQINDGLLRGVIMNASDIPGFVAFTFRPEVLERYDRRNEPDFKLTNIKVYDANSSEFVSYEIYVSNATISGYSLSRGKNHKIDPNKVDISGFKKQYIKSAYDRVANILDSEEKKLLNPSVIYSVLVGDKEYFHIKDLEDGDFIGIDEDKIVYNITHDPMEVLIINGKLSEILKDF